MKYSESSIIVRIYTELFGLQSYIVKGARSGSRKSKSKIKSNIFQPLTLVEMSVYHKEKEGLQKMKDIRIARPFSSIHQDVIKSSIALFLAEMLYKSIQEEEANINLFEYLFNGITVLDLSGQSCSNFHLYFLIQLTRHLGFYPRGEYSRVSPSFDLENGLFCPSLGSHQYHLDNTCSELFSSLINCSFEDYAFVKLDGETRRDMLNHIVTYYQLHLPNISEVHSHQVLEEVIR